MLAAQLEDRQTALTKARPDTGGDPEEELARGRKMSFGNKASRALSFSSKKKREAAAAGDGAAGEPAQEPKRPGGGMLRSMSFSRQKAAAVSGGEPAGLSKSASEGVVKSEAGEASQEPKRGGLLRSLSFSKKKVADMEAMGGSSGGPAVLKKSASEGVAPRGEAGEPAPEPKRGGLLRSLSFSKKKAAEMEQKQPAEAGGTGESGEKQSATGLARKMSFGRKKAPSLADLP